MIVPIAGLEFEIPLQFLKLLHDRFGSMPMTSFSIFRMPNYQLTFLILFSVQIAKKNEVWNMKSIFNHFEKY